MPSMIEIGEWRILHGAWSDGGASLTIIATRSTPRRAWRRRMSELARAFRLLAHAGTVQANQVVD